MTELESSVLDEHGPPNPVTSLRRIQAWYGAMEEAAGGKIGGDPEFALYYTPGALGEFVTEDPENDPRYLAAVKIDLTTDLGTYEGVDIEYLTPEKIDTLGFARYPWGRAIDHSITRRGAKGGSDADTVTTYLVECLERWTDADGREPAVGSTAKEHPDGWVLQELQRLGSDTDIQSHIESDVHETYTTDERVVATVKLKLDPSDLDRGPSGEEGWYHPGRVHVLNAAMKARKDFKLAQKQTDIPSRGTSACMVTGESEEVFGTVEDPLALFTVQHAEKFDELKRAEAWRSHPVSSNAALLLQSGSALVDACYRTRNGLRVYTLPYFVEMSKRRAITLYQALTALRERSFEDTDRHPMLQLESQVEEYGTAEDKEQLRYYVITLRNDSGDINVFHELPDATLYEPREVAKRHHDVLRRSTAFSRFAGFSLEDNWRTIGETETVQDILNLIVDGRYASGTLPWSDGDDGAMADDPVEWLSHTLLEGSTIGVEQLLNYYVERIRDEYENDDENRFPGRVVKTQFAQLEALAAAGRLEQSSSIPALTTPPHTMTSDNSVPKTLDTDGEVSQLAARRHRLETFLADRPSLSENSERRAAFLTGVLVGQMSDHQRSNRGMNRTVLDQYPADTVTIDRLVRIWPDLVQKAHVYASDVSWAGETLFPEVMEQSTESMSHPSEWTLSVQDVRFFYALGISYGQQASHQAYKLLDEVNDADGEDTESTETTA